jgi:hypothetical protein
MPKFSPSNEPLIEFSSSIAYILDNVKKCSDIMYGLAYLEENKYISNAWGIFYVDVSESPGCFKVSMYDSYASPTDVSENTIKIDVKIKAFWDYYYKGASKDNYLDLYSFISQYDELKKKFVKPEPTTGGKKYQAQTYKNYNKKVGKSIEPLQRGTPVEVPEFRFNPKNVRSTFLSLVQETYPHGNEEDIVPFLYPGLSKDKHGNYYKVIGNSNTVFTSHLDTASREKSKVVVHSYKNNGDEFLCTDGKTILGADDKSGVSVMFYMMANNVPGVYWFFIGEERGGIGSGKVIETLDEYPFMVGKNKVVSFDRRNYNSVITQQMGTKCCSDEFAQSLCSELNKSGLKMTLDNTGVFTDSANFINEISECTNISVGYFDEHKTSEIQNISFLERLAKACVMVDWENLTIGRNVSLNTEVMRKYGRFMTALKKKRFSSTVTYKSSQEGYLELYIDFNCGISTAFSELTFFNEYFTKYGIDPIIIFQEELIKITLK